MKSSNYQHLEHVNHSNHNELDLGMDEFTQQVVEDDSGNYPTNEVLEISRQEVVSTTLLDSGTYNGQLAASAMNSNPYFQQKYKFETCPTARNRHKNRLLRKMLQVMTEMAIRCGQQAAVITITTEKDQGHVKISGSEPLKQAVEECKDLIKQHFDILFNKKIAEKPNIENSDSNEIKLPRLLSEGLPANIEDMSQAQLRNFIPHMLKLVTLRGKPGWNRSEMKPDWWPNDVPWANIRKDTRSEYLKSKASWSDALRSIVISCYKSFGKDHLLNMLPESTGSKSSTRFNRRKATNEYVNSQDTINLVFNNDNLTYVYEDSADENQYMDDYNNDDGSTQYQVLHPIDESTELITLEAETNSERSDLNLNLNQSSGSENNHKFDEYFTNNQHLNRRKGEDDDGGLSTKRVRTQEDHVGVIMEDYYGQMEPMQKDDHKTVVEVVCSEDDLQTPDEPIDMSNNKSWHL